MLNLSLTTFNNSCVDIPIPEAHEYESIGIGMSGGMDSTILAAIVFPQLDATKITVYTVDQKESINTVSSILDYLGYTNVKRVTIADPKNPNGALSPVFIDLIDKVDYLYTGTNRNPPWADSIPDGQKPARFNKVLWKNMFMPFGLSYKTDLLYLYLSLNHTELLTKTHTCTERPHRSKACGACFACRERIWAFHELNVNDTVEYE